MKFRLTFVTSITGWLFSVLKKRKVEKHGDFILDPISPKEYKDMMVELNGSPTNHMFGFFKIVSLERVGFSKIAKQQKGRPLCLLLPAPVRTSPLVGGAVTKKTSKKAPSSAAATAAVEGKARKKCSARPTGSPQWPLKQGSWT
jgi:hypothetical protein